MSFLSVTDFLFHFKFITLKNIITSVFWWHYVDPPLKVTAILPTIAFGETMFLNCEHYKYFSVPFLCGAGWLHWTGGVSLTPG